MADTYEKDLAQKSSLTVNDFIRVVGTDNVSYKQLVSDVAKKIIENYIGSSLAGSSQSVKSALDALNSKPYVLRNSNQINNVTIGNGIASSAVRVFDITIDDLEGNRFVFAVERTKISLMMKENGSQQWITLFNIS